MRAAGFGGSFVPIVQYKNGKYIQYSRIFHTFARVKTLAESPCPIMRCCLKDVFPKAKFPALGNFFILGIDNEKEQCYCINTLIQ